MFSHEYIAVYILLGAKGEVGDAGASGLPGLVGIVGDAGMYYKRFHLHVHFFTPSCLFVGLPVGFSLTSEQVSVDEIISGLPRSSWSNRSTR